VRKIVGECKTKSSHAIRETLPGKVWAFRGRFIRVKDQGHHRNTYHYIRDQDDAWIWDYKQEPEKKQDEEQAQG